MANDEASSLWSATIKGMTGSCPRCGRGKLFKGLLDVAPACNKCGLDFKFIDTGDGPAVFVTLIAGLAVLGLALWAELRYEPPIWVHLVIFLPMTLIVCIGLLRPTKGLLIAMQYRNEAEEGRLEN
ncbi:DUF983 domain-containing protein [Methylocapsa acidiphila]|uniref:DUF983 domain-containing protein n=1 Tax=Methylocapsa acidiphila TaxID=133552 RepID=UPI0004227428|nr:DUF983 domain-containing protein [Methylocapsa acidiphila]